MNMDLSDSKFVDKLNKSAEVINNQKYVIAIKNTFSALLPIIMAGAFATLFSSVIFDAQNGLAQIPALSFLATFRPITSAISFFTMDFFTVYVVVLLGVEIAKQNKLNGVYPGLIGLGSYLVMNPTFVNYTTDDNVEVVVGNVLSNQFTSTKGLFLGILIAILSIELFTTFSQSDRLKIKMPDSVPTAVSNSFSALIPSIFTLAVFALLGFTIFQLTGMYAYDIIYSLIQRPLQGAIQGLPGILTLMLIAQVFWVVGIHGMQMVKPIREPLLLSAIAENTAAFEAGEAAPNIINMPFWDIFMTFGGSGATLGLLIAIFIFSKRADHRQIAKLSFIPGLFNINEPLIYGLPIVLNPILAIPFIITPLVSGTIGYIATYIGFAGKAVVMVPWPVPAVLNAFLGSAGNIGTIITQIICIIVSVLIYAPFVKMANRNAETE